MKTYVSVNGETKLGTKAYASYNGTTLLLPIIDDPNKRIFGVEWSGGASSSLTRTDDAVGFPAPSPALSNGSGSSPFDDIMPWSGMVKSTDSAAGTVVAIPKFYYKVTKVGTTMKIQISMTQYDGFWCSPAHIDRGDGAGQRDVIYVGRYHCASDYKSKTGAAPKVTITRATARTNIHNLGNKIWQWDYRTRMTIWLLYLVEYANWNSQGIIGYGCWGASGVASNTGYTNNMIYHTGTTTSTRTTYGGTQYRNIEGLWDNVFDWCDGIYFNKGNGYLIANPANFSDSSAGTYSPISRSTTTSYITTWNGTSIWYPSNTSGGSTSTYVCDYCEYNRSGVVLYVGGSGSGNQNFGLFYLNGTYAASSSNSNIGTRLMILP